MKKSAGQGERIVKMSEEQKVVLMFNGRRIAEIDFDVPEQNIEVSIYGSRGTRSNPILLSIDTQMLGHTEDEK